MAGTFINSCKSQAHVEMIISFVLFIGFIGTLLFLLNPLQSRQINYALLDITEETLLNELKINYKTTSLTLSEPQFSCFSVDNEIRLSGDLVASDESGRILDAAISSGVHIKPVSSQKFFRLYASPEFASSTLSCPRLDPSMVTYTYGTISEKSAVLYENIESFVSQYSSDYEGLKIRLGLQNDFVFYVYEIGRSAPVLNATIFIPRVTEVVARDIPIVAVTRSAEQKNLVINLRVW